MPPIKPPQGYTLDNAPAPPPGFALDTHGGDADTRLPEGVMQDAEGRYGSQAPPSMLSLYERALFDPVGSGAHSQGLVGGAEQIGGKAMETMLSPVMHPIDAVTGLAHAFAHPVDTATGLVHAFTDDWKRSPALALENATGAALGTVEGGRMTGAAMKAGMRGAGAAKVWARTAAAEPDAAGLRVMGVPASSTRSLRAIRSLAGARPFLQGTQSVADAQNTIPAALNEIWKPYQEAINTIGDRPVRGPDGMTTVRALEEERLQLSALNRGLRTGDPAALKLAEQQGITSKAEALERENAIQRALDPELEKVGIKPREIRKAFGQVSRVGQPIIGRSTIAEPAQPYGFGRMVNLRIDRPRTWIGEPTQGVRDLFAGRPWWSGKPSDVNIREAFSTGGAKPGFGSLAPQNRLKLPASVPLREGEHVGPWSMGVPNEPTFTPRPSVFAQLPTRAGEGEAEPMIWERAPSHPGRVPEFARERVRPNVFARTGEARPASGAVTREGQVIPSPRGLLTGGFARVEPPEETGLRIWPRGSTFQGEEEPQVHPHGSARRSMRRVFQRGE